MGTVITNLKARFGVDTTDFKKGLKDGAQATDEFSGAAGDSLSKFAGMFGVNMGSVNAAVGSAHKSLGFLKSSLIAAAKGGDIASISMKVLKFALISTGLGAIIVVLGTIIAYFTKTGEGADKFAKILAQVKSVVNNVIDRLAVFGKGLMNILSGNFRKGWQEMTGAFKDLGTEIKEDWKAAGALADRYEALEDKEIALIASLEARRAKAAELRLQAKEEIEDQRKKMSLLEEAKTLYNSIYKDQIGLEKERLAIMKEQLAIATSDQLDEQNRALAEQEAQIETLLREKAEQLKGLAREAKTAAAAIKKINDEFVNFDNLKVPALLDQKYYANLKRSLEGLRHTYIQLGDDISALYQVMGEVAIDVTAAINETFSTMAVGVGEFLGNLMIGNAGAQDFVRMIVGTFADLAITVGKIAIGAGLAVLGVKRALMTLNPWVAIAAGIALVAIGSAVKGSLASVASGGGSGSSGMSAGGGQTYGSYTPASAQTQTITINGELKVRGPDLVYVIAQENNRRKTVT